MQVHAVIAGDLVGSTRHGAAVTDAAMTCLAGTARQIGDWAGSDARFTRFRGDGWQMYLHLPGLSLHAGLLLIAGLRAARLGIDTRLAIGFGRVERLGSADLSDAAGEAFELAGGEVDAMPRHKRIALANPTILHDWHRAVFDLAVWTALRWSPEQAQAVALALNPQHEQTQLEIARHLGISRQAVQLRLRGAGWDALQSSLAAVLRHDWKPHCHG